MQSVLKILFVDDHSGLRDGLASYLSQKNNDLVFFTVGNIPDAVKILKDNPDINNAIMDINLNGLESLSYIKDLRNTRSSLNIIIYTMYSDPLHIEKALYLNIQGYITKDIDIEDFEKAIITVCKGNNFFNSAASNVMKSLLTKKNDNASDYKNNDDYFSKYKTLTVKEQEIFSMLAKKIHTADIAKLLNKSEKTVINQRSIIFQKMNLHDRLEIVEVAKLLGVIL